MFLDFVEESAQAVLRDGRRHLLGHALAHSAWHSSLIELAAHHVLLCLLLRGHSSGHHVGSSGGHLATLSSARLHHHVHLHHHLLHLLLHLRHHWIVSLLGPALQVHLLHALLHHLHLHLHLLGVRRAAGTGRHHARRRLLRLLWLLQ